MPTRTSAEWSLNASNSRSPTRLTIQVELGDNRCNSPKANAARHYATGMIFGDDYLVLSRSGDESAKNAHDNNLTTFHNVKDFRQLVNKELDQP